MSITGINNLGTCGLFVGVVGVSFGMVGLMVGGIILGCPSNVINPIATGAGLVSGGIVSLGIGIGALVISGKADAIANKIYEATYRLWSDQNKDDL